MDPKPANVAVIDDSKTVRKILETALRREGHNVWAYGDPIQALDALYRSRTIRPNVMFVDIGLPNFDGYDVIRYIRARPTGWPIYIVVISSRNNVLDKLKAKLVKADAFLSKPFRTEDAVAQVQQAISDQSHR